MVSLYKVISVSAAFYTFNISDVFVSCSEVSPPPGGRRLLFSGSGFSFALEFVLACGFSVIVEIPLSCMNT